MIMKITKNWKLKARALGLGLLVVLTSGGCIRSDAGVTATNLPSQLVVTSFPLHAQTPSIASINDANPVFTGICFEAALNYTGRVFVIRDAAQHIQFYNQMDAINLCRQEVTRHAFDFNNGNILAGLWTAGRGCTARHEVIGVGWEDNTKQVTIVLKFIVEGACNYELARPFWISLEGASDYSVNIIVSQ